MDSPNSHEIRALSPCNSTIRRRRSNGDPNSPEFEFWMVRNPSFPPPNLLSADELFVDGVLLPLHLLSNKPPLDPPDPNHHPDPKPSSFKEPGEEPEAEAEPESRQISAELTNGLTSSKRWKDIFKKGDKKSLLKAVNVEEKEREKRREKKSQTGATSSAELNINIWPFSRSRSAGNNGTRPRLVSGAPETRKVCSAPCSRSNSAGESKLRKWPNSPGRAGVHLGRSSPIWQVKRGGGGASSGFGKRSEQAVRSAESLGSKKDTRGKLGSNNYNDNKGRVLNVNVPTCIGYRRHHLSCRSGDDDGSIDGVGASVKKSGSNHLFSLRSLFPKKVY